MSNSQDEKTKIEIQKLLVAINDDMIKIKDELSAVQALVEENALLPTSAKLANEKLTIIAKEAGIDLGNLESVLNESADEEESQSESSDQKKASCKSTSVQSNVAIIAAATDKLAVKLKRTLKK
ncbi:uncharacterized protein LOC106640586 [Copidosoma floridanum]|uniref:uncharacterized protein LOC106640586 n=1 Tax=Copidosoma floridanum TaxID=29053 RepID=UPI0006C9E4E3|nr:uncharacterized protein LOC106640586 [Copidosoma floridanum]